MREKNNGFKQKLQQVKAHLDEHQIDGWLLYDFHRQNHQAVQFLEIPPSTHLTRRLFYWIPKEGEPLKLVHAVEPFVLDHLPGDKKVYHTWQSFESSLKELILGKKVIAMEYSPKSRIPYISLVDGGILDLIKEYGVHVVSSGAFLQYFTCVWTERQLELHLEAASHLDEIAEKTWLWISQQLKQNKTVSEYDIQQLILKEMKDRNCEMEGLPICAIGAHTADPHYTPSAHKSSHVQKGDLILIDLWCKKNAPEAVYADITRVAVAACCPSAHQQEVFDVVRQAQRKATDFIRTAIEKGHSIKGYEVDRLCRKEIEEAGYAEYFIHRTGHNIHIETHGPGANLDSFETFDERPLIAQTCFSIEPGIYLPGQFGVRLEYDVYIHKTNRIQITGGIQDNLICLGDF